MMFCIQFWFYCLASMSFSLKNPKILFILILLSRIKHYCLWQSNRKMWLSGLIIGGKQIVLLQKQASFKRCLNSLFPPKQQSLSEMIERENLDFSDQWSCRSFKNSCSLKSEGSPQKLQPPIFALNEQQMIIIQHKLPKGYCLLPLPAHFSKLQRKQTVTGQECLKLVNDKKRGRPEGSSRNQSKVSLESERKSTRLAFVKKVRYNKRNWQHSHYNSDISQSDSNVEETEHAQQQRQEEREKILQEKSSDISQYSLSSRYLKERSRIAQESAEASKLSDKQPTKLTIKQSAIPQIIQSVNVPKPEDKPDAVQKQERKVISGPLFKLEIAIKIPIFKDKNIENKAQNKAVTANMKAVDKYDQKMEQSQRFAEKFNEQFSILAKLKQHKNILPFLEPVNEQRDGAPDYYRLIASPIDLQTIEFKLQSHIYKEPGDFHEDVQRMWSNSFLYNKNSPFMHAATGKLQKYYHSLIGKRERMRQKKQLHGP